MKIGVFGTGTVGETIGSKLIALGHEVMMGSRTRDNAKAKSFVDRHEGKARSGTYEDTAKFANVFFNCTAGRYWQEVLEAAGELNLAGKILIDLSNPLDTSKGMPATLTVCNTDSIAEQIQNRFPTVKVVKALNTMWCGLMVNPKLIGGGDHNTFLSGNDAVAKNEVRKILMSFGWQDDNIMDLGDVTTARGPEMYLPLWLRIYGAGKSGTFNIKIVR